MSNLAQFPISNASGNSVDGESSNRPRFGSAPAATNFVSPPQQMQKQQPNSQHQRENSFWNCVEDGGKLLHQKSKHLVHNYVPTAWQGSILQAMDSFYDLIDCNLFQRRPPTIRFTSGNYVLQLRLWVVWLLIAILVASVLLVLYSLVATVTLELALPFYAAFSAVYWLLIWRKNFSNSDGDMMANPSSQLLNYWWCAAIVTELSAVVIRHFVMGEDLNSRNGWFDRLAHYIVPIVAFTGAKIYLDHFDALPSSLIKSSSQSEVAPSWTSGQFLWLLPFLALTYAIRYFAIQGFTLLPLLLRPFFGYLACYLAVSAVRRTAGGRPPFSRRSSVHFCEHCSNQGANRTISHSISGNSSPLHAKFNIVNKFNLVPEGDYLRFANAANRTSRRVSLPAGSLVPIRAQVKNLAYFFYISGCNILAHI